MSRSMPHSADAERAVLTSALLDGAAAVGACEGVIVPADFWSAAHATIWEACLAVVRRGHGLDQVTVRDELARSGKLASVGGDEYLLGLCESIPSAEPETFGKIIRDLSQRRHLIRVCQEQAAAGFAPEIETADYLQQTEARIFETVRDSALGGGDIETSNQGLTHFWKHVQAVGNSGGILGVRTGLPSLDKAIAGLWNEDLIIVAGRPSMGKTAFAETILVNVAERLKGNEVALFFSVEMGHIVLWPRILAKLARVDSRLVRTMPKDMPNVQRSAVMSAVEVANKLPLRIDTSSGITIAQIRSKARKLATRHKVAIVVVDYLQIVRPSRKHERRDLEVAEVALGLKELAKELGCPVVAAAQVNRGSVGRTDKRPMISDIKESGMIEQAADTILLLHRESYYRQEAIRNGQRMAVPVNANGEPEDPNAAEIIIGKSRNGITGTIPARYIGEFCQFVELDEQHHDEDFRGGFADG